MKNLTPLSQAVRCGDKMLAYASKAHRLVMGLHSIPMSADMTNWMVAFEKDSRLDVFIERSHILVTCATDWNRPKSAQAKTAREAMMRVRRNTQQQQHVCEHMSFRAEVASQIVF